MQSRCAHLRARHPPANVHLALHLKVLECLLPELRLSQCPCAARNGTRRWAVAEDAIHARLAHLVVALRVDLELHIGIEVARRFADGANV
jgi:hypothetical protein